MTDDHLREIAAARGVMLGYHDAMGVWREPTPEVLRAIVNALGEPVEDDLGTIVVRPGAPRQLPAALHGAEVQLEDGGQMRAPGELPGDIPPGYHALVAGDRSVPLIVAPDRAHMPQTLLDGGRFWGVAAQLYALRSSTSWGMGDLDDLAALPAALGGPDFLLINPLHSPTPGAHLQPSPYFASSRRFRSPLHLALESAPELALLDGDERSEFATLARRGRALNGSALIDRDAVWEVKRAALAILTRALGRGPARVQALAEFRAAQPEVERFARFCALAEHHRAADWRTWAPVGEPDPDAIELHVYAQMLAQEQLDALPAMPLGLMTDLAVGADRAGYDSWAHRAVVSPTLRVGCPPDLLGPEGQDWGVPPMLPLALGGAGYQPFAQIVRAAMHGAGGLRIDHVMGLSRLFIIPEGATARDGAYVRMPLDDLLGVVCLESRRAGCLVVGEDLGTVEEGFRERLAERALLSYRLAWFEDRPAGEYPRQTMAAVTTHDLPTVAGFFSGQDMEHLQDIGANAPELLALIAERQPGERQRLRERLAAEGIEGAWSEDPADVTTALNGFLARTPSMLACASLDDVAGAVMRANVPGTIDEHPNWRVPLPLTLERIATDERTPRILAPLRDRPTHD